MAENYKNIKDIQKKYGENMSFVHLRDILSEMDNITFFACCQLEG